MWKEYKGNWTHRGRSFDTRFCAKSNAAAARKIGESINGIKNYWFIKPITEPYEEIYVKPYGTTAVVAIGHNNEITLKEADVILDVIAKKYNDLWKGLGTKTPCKYGLTDCIFIDTPSCSYCLDKSEYDSGL